MHNVTMHAAATSYQPVQVYESERMLYDLLKEPENYEDLFERYAGAVVMRLGYGKTIETGDEPYARDVLKVVHAVERVASPGAYLVDTFPILMHLPSWLAPFKREGAQLHNFEIRLFRELLYEVRGQIKAKKAPKCFAKTFLERQDEFGLTDDEGAYVIGTLFEAGAGTTAAAMMNFVLSMCHSPEWQKKMQQEVDEVVGESRMPDFGDLPRLPTVRAVVKEVMRWRPVTAGGVPHELIKDDVYDGYFFPAGTNIHPNQWQVPQKGGNVQANVSTGPSIETQTSIPTQKPSTRAAGSAPSIPRTANPSKSTQTCKTFRVLALAGASARG